MQDTILGEWLPRFAGPIKSRPLFVVVLAPHPEVVEAREAGRVKAGYGVWGVEQLDRILREETPRLGLWIDSSDQTPEQTAEDILERTRHQADMDRRSRDRHRERRSGGRRTEASSRNRDYNRDQVVALGGVVGAPLSGGDVRFARRRCCRPREAR